MRNLDLLDGLVCSTHNHRTNHKGLILHQVDLHCKVLAHITFEESLKYAY